LVEVLGEALGLGSELDDLEHGLADSGCALLYLGDCGWVVDDSAGYLIRARGGVGWMGCGVVWG
jgi:hypothetical protein